MAEKVVTAKIDANARTVTFGRDPGLTFPETFQVKVGDTIKWNLQGVPAGARAQVRFEPLPKAPGTALLVCGNVVEGDGAVIGDQVAADAYDGTYSYGIELLTAQGATKLKCVSSDGVVPQDWPMAGGQKSGGPR